MFAVKNTQSYGNGRAVARQLGNDAVRRGDGACRTILARIVASDTKRFIVVTVDVIFVIIQRVTVVVGFVIGFGLSLAERTVPPDGTVAVHGTVVGSVVRDRKEVITCSYIAGSVFRHKLTRSTILTRKGAQFGFGSRSRWRSTKVLQRVGADSRSARRRRQKGSEESRKLHGCCLLACCLFID